MCSPTRTGECGSSQSPWLLRILGLVWTQTKEQQAAGRVLAIDRLQVFGHPVPGELAPERRRQMGDMAHFTLLSNRVGLDPGEVAFAETGGLRVRTEQELIGTIYVLDPCPDVIAVHKSQGGFEQKTVAHVTA